MVYEGKLSAGHARAILAVPNDDMRVKLAQKVVDQKLSVRQTESLAALFSVKQSDKTPKRAMPSSFKRAAPAATRGSFHRREDQAIAWQV